MRDPGLVRRKETNVVFTFMGPLVVSRVGGSAGVPPMAIFGPKVRLPEPAPPPGHGSWGCQSGCVQATCGGKPGALSFPLLGHLLAVASRVWHRAYALSILTGLKGATSGHLVITHVRGARQSWTKWSYLGSHSGDRHGWVGADELPPVALLTLRVVDKPGC